jgi:glycosyltransferase involved in cell wall biosynthesis
MSDPIEPRVLLILRTPPPFGGGEMVASVLERELGGRFSLLVFRRAGHDKRRQGRVNMRNVGFAVHYVGRSVWHIARTRPRVVYVDVPKDSASFLRVTPILMCCLLLRARVVGDLSGADFQFLRDRSLVAPFARALLRRLHAIRVLGPSVSATVTSYGLENAVPLSNGIPDPEGAHERALDPVETRLLYVGKIAESKGIFTLVDFMSQSADDDRRLALHVVGEFESDATRRRVMDLVGSLGISDRVVFHGLQVDEAKWSIFRSAHVLVHPSHWDGQPVTILEALAFGLPVVATRVGAIPDTLVDGREGYLMRDATTAELAAGVDRITSDRSTYSRFSRQARQAFEERYTASVFATRMADLLLSALDGAADVQLRSMTSTSP